MCNPKEYVAGLLEVEEYSKTKLNSFYLQDGIVEKIIEQLPEEIDLER